MLEVGIPLNVHLTRAATKCQEELAQSLANGSIRVAVVSPGWSTISHGVLQDNDAGGWWWWWWLWGGGFCPSCQLPLRGGWEGVGAVEAKSTQWNEKLLPALQVRAYLKIGVF